MASYFRTCIKILSTIFLTLMLISGIYGQSVEISGAVGVGSYRMSDLKDWQNLLVIINALPLEKTESFPVFVNFSGSISYHRKNLGVGLIAFSESTGGRLAYSDFSGSLFSDQLLSSIAVGPFVSRRLKQDSPLSFSAAILYYRSFLDLRDEVTILGATQITTEELVSSALAVQPAIQYEFKITEIFRIAPEFGYMVFGWRQALHLKENNEVFLQVNGNRADADWSGFRARVKIIAKL